MTSEAVKRKAYLSHLSTAVNKLELAMKDKVPSIENMSILLEQVSLKFQRVEDSTNRLQEKMEEAELILDISKMDELENNVTEVKIKAKSCIEQMKEMSKKQEAPPPATVYVQPQQLSAKLPEAKLQEFHGDEESFPSFLDNFNALVDSNPQLPAVEKFAYLRGCVKVDVINHFPLTADNYKPALEKLKRTYGDVSLIATKHQNALLDMSKRKKPTTPNELLEFFNFIETKITCLEALKRPIDPANQMVITLIYRQLPKTLQKKVVQLGEGATIPKVMDIISKHITTSKQMKFREESDENSDSDSDDKPYNSNMKSSMRPPANPFLHENNQPNSSSAAFPVVNRKYSCVYCNQNHSSVHCQNITNIEERKDILKKSNRCYNCLLNNHRVQECRNTGRCRYCQRKHNSSICTASETPKKDNPNSDERQNISSNYQGVTTGSSWEASKNVLLQMAQAKVKSPTGTNWITANIFFDIGSQWSYCTDELRRKLDLDILHKDVIQINTFGSQESKISNSYVVAIDINKQSFNKRITLHTSAQICNPLPSYNISRRKLRELQDIELAFPDVKHDGTHKIDVLIGADLYWEFIKTETVNTSFGARAIDSELGWILSGPISNNATSTTSINIVNSKILKTLSLDSLSPHQTWVKESVAKAQSTMSVNYELDVGCCQFPIIGKRKNMKPNRPTTVNAVINTYEPKYEQLNLDPIEAVHDWFQFKSQFSLSDSSCKDLSWFWDLEHLGITPEDQEPSILQEFLQNITYLKEAKRYEVEFPCKFSYLNKLPDNYHLCQLRLLSLLKKLNKKENADILRCYQEVIDKQLESGIIEETKSNTSVTGVIHYLPHHCVVRNDKPSTQVRIVYDGSAKANKHSPSLNQCLHAGPSLVNSMVSVLLQFRMYRFGIVADISKAFLQIQIKEKDRDLTRFIWKENGNIQGNLKTYRFTRVPFGLASSPFLLNATLKFHISQYDTSKSKLIERLLHSFYVDDMVTGSDTEEEGISLIQQSHHLMNEASMSLSKWNCSSKNIIENSSIEQVQKSIEDTTKVLGLRWNTLDDIFFYDVSNIQIMLNQLKPCKRTILRVIQKIYDPLGLLSPYMITAKLLLQNLCKAQITWDEELPEKYSEEWLNWIKDLHNVNYLNFPRFVMVSHMSNIELIGFCDASKSAYAAAVYLKSTYNSVVHCNLLISKSRVAPMKSLTIPRLELLGAVLLVRLMSTVKSCLSNWNITNVSYFSDSMNVIYWIRGSKKWNLFVSKRLEEIYGLSSKSQWNYCKSQENPADLPTRGVPMNELLEIKEWFHGPLWLSNGNLPNGLCSFESPPKECLEEEMKISHNYVTTSTQQNIGTIIALKNYNKYMKLLRVSAYILMFIQIKVKKNSATLLNMIELAEKRWIMSEQEHYYPNLIKILNGQICNKKSSLINQLQLFMDSDGIIRCSGRYKYSDMSYSLKYPIFLPRQSHLTTLIVHHRHVRAKHAGMKITLLEVREDYWIPQCRKIVQLIINHCVICRRLNAKPFVAPLPPPLPPTRLSDLPPFTHTGVDYAGPLYLKERGCKDAYKSYIALFTCASSRALHLELVPSMNSTSFKNGLIRFISIWGAPRYMISDNAKSFRKSAEDLNSIITRSPTKEYLEDKRIIWLFYLEKSPWWGGFIERLVGSVKSPLRKILYRTFLSFDEMSTLIKEIQSIINSRPITYIYSDDVDEPLTPSHLLIGKRSTQLPLNIETIEDVERPNQYREKIITKFQSRWKKEYLSELQDYHIRTQKAHDKETYPNIGDVVIMKEDSLRSNWKLARVTNIFKGRDGKLRSIEVIKPNKEITRRPPQLLIPLECKSVHE